MKFDSVDELIRRMDEDCRTPAHRLARVPAAFPELGVPSAE